MLSVLVANHFQLPRLRIAVAYFDARGGEKDSPTALTVAQDSFWRMPKSLARWFSKQDAFLHPLQVKEPVAFGFNVHILSTLTVTNSNLSISSLNASFAPGKKK